MPKFVFILLRAFVAFAALGALAVTALVILFEGALELVKGGFHIGVALARFLASGLRDPGPNPPPPQPIHYTLVALAILFFAMFVSVFTPGQRIFLHILAGAAIAAAAWRVWIMLNSHDHHFLFIPVILLWIVYYLVCLQRA